MDALVIALVVAGSYYATTLALWAGHWFSHLPWSPLRGFHLSGHHTFYPTSRAMRSAAFRYGAGRSSSLHALLPWLLVETALAWALLPTGRLAVWIAVNVAVTAAMNYIHVEFHLLEPRLERFAWFATARRRHALHHDLDVNFMVADHLWDRVLGTYRDDDRSAFHHHRYHGDAAPAR